MLNSKSQRFSIAYFLLQRNSERVREIAMLEACVYQLAEKLSEHRAATIENVQRRQARTLAEREEEGDSDEENEVGGGGGGASGKGAAEATVEAEDDDIPYNPKNLPLGWDGKVSIFFSNCFLCNYCRQTVLASCRLYIPKR